MTDLLSPARRSALMARVKSRDTRPEIAVRRMLHAAGYRFRLHRRDLPGTPDIVLPSRRIIIFVHGCFWHGHSGCRLATIPKTRTEFWRAKIQNNQVRDRQCEQLLRDSGWRVLTFWECQ